MNDNYPAGMSECERVGIGGNCGNKCPVYQRGKCEFQGTMGEDAELINTSISLKNRFYSIKNKILKLLYE